MPDIRDVQIRQLGIRDIVIPDKLTSEPPLALPVYPPVTTQVGVPIVNIPGCVKAHKDNKENVNLKDADDKGIMTLCDAGTPSFSPIDYDTSELDLEQDSLHHHLQSNHQQNQKHQRQKLQQLLRQNHLFLSVLLEHKNLRTP